MGIFSGIGEFLFGHGPDVGAAQGAATAGTDQAIQALTQGRGDAMSQLQMGLDQAGGTLQPAIGQGQQLTSELQNLLMGNTPIESIPGFNAMSDARRQAVGDLGTGMAGTGKFFSGTTASRAGDIGGAMQNQLMQQRIQNLMMGAQPGQQATNQLANFQMGAGTTGANIFGTAGTNLANLQQTGGMNMGNLIMGDQTEGHFGDILGAAATLGGAYMGSQAPVPAEG